VASDLTSPISAASGLMTAVIDPSTNQHLTLAGSQALLSAGQAVAVAALHGLDRHRGSQRPVHADVSAQEAVISTGPVLSCLQELFHNRAASGAARNGAHRRETSSCRDGLIRISAMEQHQWAGTAEAMGRPELATVYGTSALRVEHAPTIIALVNEWCGPRSKFECESVLQAKGVPASAMLTPEEFLTSKQILARNALVAIDVDGAKAQIVDVPFEIEQGEDEANVGRQSYRLEGLRVTEISQVLAMPLAGSVLGAMGASVTKLEDPDRLDTYRRRGPYIDEVEGPDRNVFFSGMNHSKRSRLIKYDTDVEGLASILDESDVLMENLGYQSGAQIAVGLVDPSTTSRPDTARAEFHGVRSDRAVGRLPRLRLQHRQRLAGCVSHADDGGHGCERRHGLGRSPDGLCRGRHRRRVGARPSGTARCVR
jgi:crotonobetainyl-CoA:carnitine CoA-transferase CaiB-like acyl-CoA transferase